MAQPKLHRILSVMLTSEPDVYVVRVDATTTDGDRVEVDFLSRPNDPYGIGPEVRQAVELFLATAQGNA